MEVTLDKRYPLEVDPARAWAVLRDLRAVAGCMPGAELTEELSPTHYKGGVKVKVGPALANFGGEVEVLELDEAAQRMRLKGKGADRGGSSASMDLTATVEPGETPQTAVLVGLASVIVNGKFAQFGGRMMVSVSDMVLGQFVANFGAAAAALPVSVSEAAAAAPVAEASAPEIEAAPSAAASPVPAVAAVAPAPRPAPPVAKELNGLAIVWALIKNWFGGLFGRRT